MDQPGGTARERLGAAGWALLAWMLGRDLCSLLLQSLAARWGIALPLGSAVRWGIGVAACYGAGLPLAAWCMTRVPGARRPEAAGTGPATLPLCLIALLGLMYGANGLTLAFRALVFGPGGGAPGGLAAYPAALTAVQTVVFAPLAEEWLFRGLMLRRLLPLGEQEAVALSALCFALSHGSGGQLLYAAAGGAVLGYTAVRTGRLWPCIALHVLANALALLLPELGTALSTAAPLALAPLGLVSAGLLWRQRPLTKGGGSWAGFWRPGGMPLALLYALLLMALG